MIGIKFDWCTMNALDVGDLCGPWLKLRTQMESSTLIGSILNFFHAFICKNVVYLRSGTARYSPLTILRTNEWKILLYSVNIWRRILEMREGWQILRMYELSTMVKQMVKDFRSSFISNSRTASLQSGLTVRWLIMNYRRGAWRISNWFLNSTNWI